MARDGVLLWNLRRLCRVLLFLSQFYILSGGGSFSVEPSQPLAQSDKDPGPTRTFTVVPRAAESTDIPPYMMKCPSNGLCSKLPADCIECKTNFSCVYGKPVTFDCTVKPSVTCVDQDFKSRKSFVLNMTCRFCWQLPETDYECSSSTSCMAVSCPRQRYTANCTVRDHVHCLGNRTFPKMLYCNWTGGYKWSTALALRWVTDNVHDLIWAAMWCWLPGDATFDHHVPALSVGLAALCSPGCAISRLKKQQARFS
nr:TM2 domain-containing protein 3 isoform X1 [Globicephala melas]